MTQLLLILNVLNHGLYGLVLSTLHLVLFFKLFNGYLLLLALSQLLELLLEEVFPEIVMLVDLLFNLPAVTVVEHRQHKV